MKAINAALTILMLCTQSVGLHAQQTVDEISVKTTAQAYLSAVEAMDWDAMAGLLTEESVFEDRTAEHFGEGWHYVGANAITAFYADAASETLSTQYNYLLQYVAGPLSVNVIRSDVRIRGGIIGFPEKLIEDSINVVTVLTIKDGKVLRHTDYADYAGMWQKLESHRAHFQAGEE